jgi:[ribosomal protein S5]-alanine N-acetyltransferase
VQVRLVTPGLALIEAAIAGPQPLERALGCEVAEGWDVFPESLPRARDHLAADPARARWGMRLFLAGEPPTLVGWGGFKGMPRDGTVELGYAVAPSWEGRGIATAAVNAMLDEAFADPEVLAVIAHTLAEPGPSPRVLEKAGFAHAGAIAEGDDGVVWRYRLER